MIKDKSRIVEFLVIAVILSTFVYLIVSEGSRRSVIEQKCEVGGWTWLPQEGKCIMVKEVK